MTLDAAARALLWCAVINYALLILWSVLLLTPHQWMYRLCTRAAKISEERFDAINFGAMVHYKIAILLFNLVPYVGLRIVGAN